MEALTNQRRGVRLSLYIVLLVALALRFADFPARYEQRSVDERPYTQGGLALWEGITPTFKYAPAGPQTWISWADAAAESTRHLLRPGPEEQAAPLVLRPFVAVNHALFDIYHDWSKLRRFEAMVSVLCALAAVGAGFALGLKRGGGLPGALIVAGMTATLPLFVQMSVEARPYMMGWGLGLIALCLGADSRATASAIVMGLAVGTRIEMLMLLPLAYADLGPTPHFARRVVRYTAIAAMTSLLIAPWLLTNLLGNLRTIATVRVAEPNGAPVSRLGTISEIVVHQGLGIVILLAVLALFLSPPGRKRPRWVAAIYVLLLAASMVKATHFGLQHQGAPIIALIAFSAVGAAAVWTRWPAAAWALVVVALVPPLLFSVRDIARIRNSYVPAHATAWLNRHVPPGTRVYLTPSLNDPLPTVAASDALWAEVTENNSWELKLKAGLTRFHVSTDDLPRALSEENMIIERGYRREWFILGSRPQVAAPRFDIRVFSNSQVYSVQDVAAEFSRTGGVLVCDDANGIMPTDLGRRMVEWVSPAGTGVRIYCSPDLVDKLLDRQHLQEW